MKIVTLDIPEAVYVLAAEEGVARAEVDAGVTLLELLYRRLARLRKEELVARDDQRALNLPPFAPERRPFAERISDLMSRQWAVEREIVRVSRRQ
jgi:hypothetical protein